MSKPSVAIFGLGIMGSGMARRLLTEKFSVAVYNRNREKAVPLGDAGAFVAATPREAAARAQIIVSMVADDNASRDVWAGKDGALSGAASGSVLIESSTLSIGWVKELAGMAAERGCQFLDAPVTGTKPHAASGELLFLVGGSPEVVEAARTVFSALGRDVIHLGPTGSGALMKLINNFLCGVQAASFAEALALVEASGLDRGKVLSILAAGAPGSLIVKRMTEKVAANNFEPAFALRWMAKDISYAIQSATEKGLSLPTAAAALGEFQQAMAQGHGDEDFAAVARIPEGKRGR
jgi:3-hydroxyisobutyrate dehydrogenase